jgi:hypothetical protein
LIFFCFIRVTYSVYVPSSYVLRRPSSLSRTYLHL